MTIKERAYQLAKDYAEDRARIDAIWAEHARAVAQSLAHEGERRQWENELGDHNYIEVTNRRNALIKAGCPFVTIQFSDEILK